jgi:hypothetical protein
MADLFKDGGLIQEVGHLFLERLFEKLSITHIFLNNLQTHNVLPYVPTKTAFFPQPGIWPIPKTLNSLGR